MKRTFSIVVAIVLALGLQTTYSAQSPATIEGVVLDSATNQPLAGVRISLSTTGATPPAFNPSQGRLPDALATTDSQGHFSIETKETGRLRVVPSKDGYIYSRLGQTRAPAQPGVWVQVAPGERVKDLELRMARPAVISGRVLNAEGKPIVGSAGSVTLMRYTYGTDGKRSLGWVPGISYPGAAGSFQRMNDQGEFRFYDIPPGEYYLRVSGGGGAIGFSGYGYYYPGVTEEARAVPIRVVGGDDIRLGTLVLPARQKGVEVKLRISGAPEPLRAGVRVYIADAMMVFSRPRPNPEEIVLPQVAPGHYDVLVRSESFLRTALFYYAAVTLDIGNANVEQEVVVKRGSAVTANVLLEDESGKRSPAPQSMRCRIRSRFGLDNCDGSQVVPGLHELDFQGLPPDAYLLSAKVGDRDVLAEGLNISGDTQFEIVLATPGAIVQGTVRNAGGDTLPDSVVALVPDAPYRGAGPLYRSVVADPRGRFEIHGVAPGSYNLFAWPELEGAAYRNADFMKEFEGRGKPAKVEKGSRLSVDITAF